MEFMEVKVDDVIHGYVEDSDAGRRTAAHYVQTLQSYRTASVLPTGRRIPQGARRIDR